MATKSNKLPSSGGPARIEYLRVENYRALRSSFPN